MTTAHDVLQVLEAIAKKNGGILKPEDVLAEATKPDHPLHSRFEWDDGKAAHAHRIDQARTIIRSVKVNVTVDKRQVSTVFYVRNPDAEADESGYVGLPRLRTNKERSAQALEQAYARALALLTNARDLAAALGVESDVDDVVSTLNAMAAKIPVLRAA